MAKEKCACGALCYVFSLIVGVVGLYSLVLGFKTQWTSALVYNNWMAMLYYLVGILLLCGVKMHIWKSHMK
jgi:hypothetical protein